MSVEIAWKQNILVTDSYLLKLLLVVFGLGLQAFICDFSRQNICSVGLTRKFASQVGSKRINIHVRKEKTYYQNQLWTLVNPYHQEA